MGSCCSCGRRRRRKETVDEDEVGRPAARVPTKSASDDSSAAAASRSSGGKDLVFFGEYKERPPFHLEDLLRSSTELLGKGTFGTTYKTMLKEEAVVVKRLRRVNLAERELAEWVETIGEMEHRNLLELRAHYGSKDEKLLVYDYFPMGSLSAFLHGSDGSPFCPWPTRLNVALTAARGIEYIHSRGPNVCHGNIKSSNILLDDKFESRVADHLLAQLPMHKPTPTFPGSYRAPEVVITDPNMVSHESDVYSFGILLLELLTGRPPTSTTAKLHDDDDDDDDGEHDLLQLVLTTSKEKWPSELIDQQLTGFEDGGVGVVELMQIAVDCCALSPSDRLAMSEVVARIEEIKNI